MKRMKHLQKHSIHLIMQRNLLTNAKEVKKFLLSAYLIVRLLNNLNYRCARFLRTLCFKQQGGFGIEFPLIMLIIF